MPADPKQGPDFSGVISLLLTPFDHQSAIDWDAYDAYVDWQLQQGPHGLFAVCGTSEMKWLALDERLKLARRAVARAGDIPVIATANLELDLSKHVDELHAMEETGVSGVVLVPSADLGLQEGRLEAHLGTLADAASLPVLLYEWPQERPYLLASDSFGRLVRDHGVVGIKDTTCTPEGIAAKIEAAPEAIVYQANTPFLPESIAAGARGIVAITSSACTDLVRAYWEAAGVDPQGERARSLHAQLVFLDAIMRMSHPLLAKHLLRLRGLSFPLDCRWPLSVSPEVLKALTTWYEAWQAKG